MSASMSIRSPTPSLFWCFLYMTIFNAVYASALPTSSRTESLAANTNVSSTHLSHTARTAIIAFCAAVGTVLLCTSVFVCWLCHRRSTRLPTPDAENCDFGPAPSKSSQDTLVEKAGGEIFAPRPVSAGKGEWVVPVFPESDCHSRASSDFEFNVVAESFTESRRASSAFEFNPAAESSTYDIDLRLDEIEIEGDDDRDAPVRPWSRILVTPPTSEPNTPTPSRPGTPANDLMLPPPAQLRPATPTQDTSALCIPTNAFLPTTPIRVGAGSMLCVPVTPTPARGTKRHAGSTPFHAAASPFDAPGPVPAPSAPATPCYTWHTPGKSPRSRGAIPFPLQSATPQCPVTPTPVRTSGGMLKVPANPTLLVTPPQTRASAVSNPGPAPPTPCYTWTAYSPGRVQNHTTALIALTSLTSSNPDPKQRDLILPSPSAATLAPPVSAWATPTPSPRKSPKTQALRALALPTFGAGPRVVSASGKVNERLQRWKVAVGLPPSPARAL